jgi:hypothetical protein
MAYTNTASVDDLGRTRLVSDTHANSIKSQSSAVSWGAIVAGAAAAAALSLILLILGVGLGLSSVSPWARDGVSATTFGVSTILWLTATQLAASAMGGYIAGRLRSKWIEVHTDEVYFRDTAHGFLAWAVATLTTAALLSSVIGSILGGGVQAGAAVAGGAASTAVSAVSGVAGSSRLTQGMEGGPMGYFVDSLFRRDASAAGNAVTAEASDRASSQNAAEVSRIFMNVGRAEALPAEDIRYVGQLVAQRTGLSQQNAEQRVAAVYAQAQAKFRAAEQSARDAADKARKASAYSALWLFISLLVGAFVASLAATFGGRRRDA